MPFATYKDFDDCVAKNRDKRNPQAYCGKIKHAAEGSSHNSPKKKSTPKKKHFLDYK